MKAALKILIILPFLLPALASAESGDNLFAVKDEVLRAGPGEDYPRTLEVETGRELVELRREGGWVLVFTPDREGIEGWISAASLGEERPPPDLEHAEDPVFEKFKYEVFSFNDQIKAINVTGYYLAVQKSGEGVEGEVWVVINNSWLGMPPGERASNLRYLMRMWRSVQQVKRPLTVQILDARSTKIMRLREEK